MNSLRLPNVIGHRGSPDRAPENTLAGFAEAARLGVRWVELDVQLSADGTPVVFHDDRLDRTSNGQGWLIETSLTALRKLDAGQWFDPRFSGEPIPLLAEVLSALIATHTGVCLEIKADEAHGEKTAEVGLAVARAIWPTDREPPMVSSFAKSALGVAQKIVPDWPRAYLIDQVPADWIFRAKELDCRMVHTHHNQLTAEKVTEIKQAGFGLMAYVVNDALQAQSLWRLGVDGVFSDKPSDLLNLT